MGECLERLGRLDEASEYYKASLVLDPAFPDAFIGLGVLARFARKPPRSLRSI